MKNLIIMTCPTAFDWSTERSREVLFPHSIIKGKIVFLKITHGWNGYNTVLGFS